MTNANKWLHVAIAAPPTDCLDTGSRQQISRAAADNFALDAVDAPSESAVWPNPPPAARADQLKAWLAEHWLAIEEPVTLLLPGDAIEPGVLNVAMPSGDDLFIGVASLNKFIDAIKKLTGKPPEAIFLRAKQQGQPVWIAQ